MCKCLYVGFGSAESRFGAAESDTEASLHLYEALLPSDNDFEIALEVTGEASVMPQYQIVIRPLKCMCKCLYVRLGSAASTEASLHSYGRLYNQPPIHI